MGNCLRQPDDAAELRRKKIIGYDAMDDKGRKRWDSLTVEEKRLFMGQAVVQNQAEAVREAEERQKESQERLSRRREERRDAVEMVMDALGGGADMVLHGKDVQRVRLEIISTELPVNAEGLLQWTKPLTSVHESPTVLGQVDLTNISRIRVGKRSDVLSDISHIVAEPRECFTIYTPTSSLNLQAIDHYHRDLWVKGLRILLRHPHPDPDDQGPQMFREDERMLMDPLPTLPSSTTSLDLNSDSDSSDYDEDDDCAAAVSADGSDEVDVPPTPESSARANHMSPMSKAKALHALLKGSTFTKFCRGGQKPRQRKVWVDTKRGRLRWGRSKFMDFHEIIAVRQGLPADLVERYREEVDIRNVCLSVVSTARTLDLAATSAEARDLWMKGLRKLIHNRSNMRSDARSMSVQLNTPAVPGQRLLSNRKQQPVHQPSALPPVLEVKDSESTGGAPVQASGSLLLSQLRSDDDLAIGTRHQRKESDFDMAEMIEWKRKRDRDVYLQ